MLFQISIIVLLAGNIFLSLNPGLQPSTATRTPLGYPIYITSPKTGQALQGIIAIQGSSAMTNYSSSEIEFSYANNPTNTWFPISYTKDMVKKNLLAKWDTTVITDGTYTLRLKVITTDGKEYLVVISDLRVRNYTPIETDTPAPFNEAIVPSSTANFTETPTLLTPTALPTNPAQFTSSDIYNTLSTGTIAAIMIFVIFGIYIGLKRIFQKVR